jgi:hypothetical protein
MQPVTAKQSISFVHHKILSIHVPSERGEREKRGGDITAWRFGFFGLPVSHDKQETMSAKTSDREI